MPSTSTQTDHIHADIKKCTSKIAKWSRKLKELSVNTASDPCPVYTRTTTAGDYF